MTALMHPLALVCLLISCQLGHGERILMESKEIGINATSLAPGYKPCPQRPGASGVFPIEVPGLAPFHVYCEADIAGPGWIVIARRTSDERNFFLKWQEYKQGFGSVYGDFFIGLDKLHAITATQNHELYIRLEDFEGQIRYARYDQFYIENENMQYQLTKVNGFSGDAGDSMAYQKGMRFSTFDNNNSGHCVIDKRGAWWYNNCSNSNLFGLYLGGAYSSALETTGMYWNSWHGGLYSFKNIVMMARPT